MAPPATAPTVPPKTSGTWRRCLLAHSPAIIRALYYEMITCHLPHLYLLLLLNVNIKRFHCNSAQDSKCANVNFLSKLVLVSNRANLCNNQCANKWVQSVSNCYCICALLAILHAGILSEKQKAGKRWFFKWLLWSTVGLRSNLSSCAVLHWGVVQSYNVTSSPWHFKWHRWHLEAQVPPVDLVKLWNIVTDSTAEFRLNVTYYFRLFPNYKTKTFNTVSSIFSLSGRQWDDTEVYFISPMECFYFFFLQLQWQ